MEVKINKEIRDYTEKIYFGLTLRQFIFTILACCMAIFLYFLFRKHVGSELLSWICMIGSVPFIFFGFVKYNELTAEQLLIAYIRSEFLIPKKLTFKPTNYYELLENVKEVKESETTKQII